MPMGFVQISMGMLPITTSTSDELFSRINISDFERPWTTKIRGFVKSWQIYQNTTFVFIVIVDVSATMVAFVRTIVHQVSLWRTVSNHRCVEVGRTPRLGSSTCRVLSWCLSLPWSIDPSCCFLCRSLWQGPSLWRGSKRWRGLWLLTCFALLLRIYWCFVCKPLHHVV